MTYGIICIILLENYESLIEVSDQEHSPHLFGLRIINTGNTKPGVVSGLC